MLLLNDTAGYFPEDEAVWNITLITKLHLFSRLRSGSIPIFSHKPACPAQRKSHLYTNITETTGVDVPNNLVIQVFVMFLKHIPQNTLFSRVRQNASKSDYEWRHSCALCATTWAEWVTCRFMSPSEKEDALKCSKP